MLAPGKHFSDWSWAGQAFIGSRSGAGGDWFEINPDLVHADDPDCVVRRIRATGRLAPVIMQGL